MSAHADEIWNRACDISFEPTQKGDRALAAVIGFHSLLMSGGFSNSLEVNYAQARRAAAAFRFFGAEELGQLVDDACSIVARPAEGDHELTDLTEAQEEELLELDGRYYELVPTDARLVDIFRRYSAEHPEQFEPLR